MLPIQNSLYRIKKQHLYLLTMVEEALGELTPEIENALQLNEQDLEDGADSYCGIIKHCTVQSAAIDEEIKRLKDLKAKVDKTEDLFRKQIADAMELFNVERIETTFSKISFRKADSVFVEDERMVSPQYWDIPAPVISKTRIKEDLKAGKIVAGAIIVTKKHIQIK